MSLDLSETTTEHRLVLLALARHAERGEMPVTADSIRPTCQECLGAADAPSLGTVNEADVTRALNDLLDRGLVTEDVEERSAVGKGRPRYTLAADVEALRDALAEDDRLVPVLQAEE